MLSSFDRVFQLILTSLQLLLFAVLGCLNVYKVILSKNNNAKFLLVFYLFAFLDISVYLGMMIYQLVKLVLDIEMHLIVLVMINVYTMIVQAFIISMLSFYWKETEALLRGSGFDSVKSVSGIKKQLTLKTIFLGVWLSLYSTFLAYAIITDNYMSEQIYRDIFYFGGQGVSVFFLIWANVSQAMNARQFSFTLKRYQSLVSYQMKKGNFRCIYWVATTVNFLRLGFLIVATIFFRIKTQSEQQEWVGLQIYTASALIPLAIYIYSFQVTNKKSQASFNQFDASQKSQKQTSSLYQPPSIMSPQRKKKSNKQRQSFNQTQLSSSYDSHNGI